MRFWKKKNSVDMLILVVKQHDSPTHTNEMTQNGLD